VVSGLDLLAAQAVGQVELMTGQLIDVEVLRRAGRQALGTA
jgi:shikimate 5-dehydrogenase